MRKHEPDTAKALIDSLLIQAAADPDFEKWKAEHPEKDAAWQAMTREEKTAHLIDLLDRLGLIKPDEPNPEPEQDSTPEEEAAATDFESLTPEEQRGFIEYVVLVDGFSKALEQIAKGEHKSDYDLIIDRFKVSKGSGIAFMAMGYAAGVSHGMEFVDRISNIK